MDFGNFRKKSVKIGKDRKCNKGFGCLPENAGCIPTAVVIIFLISDLYRVDTESAKVHANIAQSFFNRIIPLFTLSRNKQCFLDHALFVYFYIFILMS